MSTKKPSKPVQPPDRFSKSTLPPGFDSAMRKIVGVSKAEIDRREQAERDAKTSSG